MSGKREVGRKQSAGSTQEANVLINMTSKDLSDIFEWVDSIPLSRPKKNINRDFSDGVLFAEVLASFFPKLVEMHNYPATCSATQKKNNWEVLNKKVLTKIGLKIPADQIADLVQAKVGAIEMALKSVYEKVRGYEAEKEKKMAAEVAASARGDGNDGDNSSNGNPGQDDVCQVYGNPEDGLIYRGVKMVPASIVEEKDTRIKELEHTLKELRKKVRRQETLVALKEEHLQDLTFQLHDMRLKEEQAKKAAQAPPKLNRWVDSTGLV